MPSNVVYNSFWCPNCGNKAMELSRRRGRLRERFHRKKLYCPTCQRVLNCIECKTAEDIEEFKWNFDNGLYQEEMVLELQEVFVPTGLME